jgi:hypothetical protein
MSAFEKLIAAYKQIADALPRFDRLSAAFKDNPDFQQVLGIVYADILAFHERAYKFFKRPGWKTFFKSTWARFDLYFDPILKSLAKNTELVDREAVSVSIVEAKEWRMRIIAEAVKRESDISSQQFREVLSWLKLGDNPQEEELEHQLRHCYPGTCNWIIRHSKILTWMRQENSVLKDALWLKGKPGSGKLLGFSICVINLHSLGKTVLCASLAQFLRRDPQSTVLYYFCNNYRSSDNKSILTILRSFCSQILCANPDLSAYVFDEYARKGSNASVAELLVIIPTLLSRFHSVRMIVDGIDEWAQPDQELRKTLTNLLSLTLFDGARTSHKLLISSRDVPQIGRFMAKKGVLSLSEESKLVDAGIRAFVHSRVADIITNLRESVGNDIDLEVLERIETEIVEKSDGMFLWVKLVLATLEDAGSISEFKDAIKVLPKELEEVYVSPIK